MLGAALHSLRGVTSSEQYGMICELMGHIPVHRPGNKDLHAFLQR
jgi:hypothetical protein